jgi:tetratricopeptide (TPR) repeat protein
MKNVLHRTMQSLEAALRYNPDSIELKASLAEVYVRIGRFDKKTIELCEAVLGQQPNNLLLQQAQSIGMLIEQSREIENNLESGLHPPADEVLVESIQILEEYISQSGDCVDSWIALTRFQILAGNLTEARKGMDRLNELGTGGLGELLDASLKYAAQKPTISEDEASYLSDIFRELGSESQVVRLFEQIYDNGNYAAGPVLLQSYLKRYNISQAGGIPEEVRSRLLTLLMDHGSTELTGRWLRKATILGWGVSDYTRDYAENLMELGSLDEAFAVLQRMLMDQTIKEMLNGIAQKYEDHDEVEKAVSVLRYINDNELIEPEEHYERESELVRQAELTIAEMQMKNGRLQEALSKYISALISSPEIDLSILDSIEELMERITLSDPEPLLRLGMYFRGREDNPKALSFLDQALKTDPQNNEIILEMESLYTELLESNPDLAQLRMELGKLYFRTGQEDKAIEQFSIASETSALSADANRVLAELYLNRDQMGESLGRYRLFSPGSEDLEQMYELYTALAENHAYRDSMMALELIARVNPLYKDVGEKLRMAEDQMGKLKPEVVVDPKMRELIGDLAVGRYQYVDRLGSGGMGVVHKVFDIRNQKIAAMKILRDSLNGSSKALDRFFREARIAASLDHRHIVEIYDYNISNSSGQSYIVMEYVDGASMREIIDRVFQDTISISIDYLTEVLYYSVQLCDALEASHNRGIIHRDIKPDNVMINSMGEVKITDFGIVHIEEANFTPTGAILGTPRYMAPEQVAGTKIDGRSDIYSVGIVLYESMVGSPPFMSGDVSYQQVHNKPNPPRDVNPIIPAACNEIIMKCLEKNPDERYPNTGILKSKLIEQLDILGGCKRFQDRNHTEVCEDGLKNVYAQRGIGATDLGSDDELDMDVV